MGWIRTTKRVAENEVGLSIVPHAAPSFRKGGSSSSTTTSPRRFLFNPPGEALESVRYSIPRPRTPECYRLRCSIYIIFPSQFLITNITGLDAASVYVFLTPRSSTSRSQSLRNRIQVRTTRKYCQGYPSSLLLIPGQLASFLSGYFSGNLVVISLEVLDVYEHHIR